jgi:ABC-2 type transport system permease protein
MVSKILNSKLWWLWLLAFLFGLNFLASQFHSRYDLTKEKRYTLSKATKKLLRNLDAPVEINVLIDGKSLPAEVRKLQNSIREFLTDCREYGSGKLRFKFTNPYTNLSDSSQSYMEDSLNYFYGIFPSMIDAPEKVGDKMEIVKVIHGAIVSYGDTTIGVNLLKGVKNYGTQREERAALYNDIEATLEYRFASAIEKITTKTKPVIAYAKGHGEGWGYNVNDAVSTLFREYYADTFNIKTAPYIPSEIKALVILKPTEPFTDADKFKIDQYIMRGGRIFWMIDNMYAEFDSLAKSQGFTAFDRGLGLDDILFRYGARLNQNLLQDMQCDKLPQMSGEEGNAQQTQFVDWPYFPVLNGTSHPITKNLDGVRAIFPNTLDTIKVAGVKKTYLLKSSAHARTVQPPVIINFDFIRMAPEISQFKVKDTGVALLLEGKFSSLYEGRVGKETIDSLNAWGVPYKNSSDETKMIVVADGDIAMNQVSQFEGPLPMGRNLYTKYDFANKEFFTNTLEFLVNESGILETRAKDFTLRLLDPVKIKDQKTTWQFINIALPVLLVILCGWIYQQIRKRKYAA